jgi:hypothetical protein
MPPAHFMRDDLLGVALATLLFGLLFIPPGFAIAWLFDLLNFRSASTGWRIITALQISVAMVPAIEFLLWSYLTIAAVWTFHLLAIAISVVLIVRSPLGHLKIGTSGPTLQLSPDRQGGDTKWIIITALAWLAIVWASGIDLQLGNRLFPSVLAYDYNVRSAVIDGIARLGVPAKNPFYFPGHFELLRYHYFWFLPCSLVERAGGSIVSARQALIASDVWCGWALMAVVGLVLRYLHPAGERGLNRRAKWAILLLAVAGLDIIPNLIFAAIFSTTGAGLVFASSEWWNNQVTGFPTAVLWVAHHVASLIACFTGLLLLLRSRGKIAAAVCAGLCFASATGLSIFVTLTFALFLIPCGTVMLWKKAWPERRVWLAAGATTIAAAMPYLLGLRGAGGTSEGSFITLTVRSMTFLDIILPGYGLSWNQIAWVNLAALPLNYFLETGLAFVLAGVWLRRAWRRRKHLRESELIALGLFLTALFVATFLRSSVISSNDLAWRGALVGQLILPIWLAGPLSAWWRMRGRRGLITTLIILGLGSSVYELVIARSYLPLMEARKVPVAEWFSKTAETGRRTFDVRFVYEQLRRELPKDAIVQANPTHWNDLYHGLYSGRQTAAFDSLCGSVLGGDPAPCSAMQRELAPLFVNDGDIDRACDAWNIRALIAKDDDPIFKNHSAWPWTRPPLAVSEHVRAVHCSTKP